jgi:hypothetical protein
VQHTKVTILLTYEGVRIWVDDKFPAILCTFLWMQGIDCCNDQDQGRQGYFQSRVSPETKEALN